VSILHHRSRPDAKYYRRREMSPHLQLRNVLQNAARHRLLRPPASNAVYQWSLNGQCTRRTFAQSSAEISSSKSASPKPPKPKESTPLRRAASASRQIRSNPTPTRSTIQPISTLTTSERYLLPSLRAGLPQASLSLHDAIWVPKLSVDGKEGEVFFFTNGTFVCWGLDEDAARQFATETLAATKGEVFPLKEFETEDLEFVMDPSENTRLQGDLIILGNTPHPESDDAIPVDLPSSVLPAETLLARYAFSQALARSTALSALETSLDEHLASMALLPESLVKHGRPGMSRVALVKKLGELLQFRQGLNLNRENFSDTPDFYWTEPVLEGYFNSLSNALEIRLRLRSVNDKITYAAETQAVLRQLLTETSGHRMELIIILLIAVEVVICLIRDGPELWELTLGKHQKPQSTEKTEAATMG